MDALLRRWGTEIDDHAYDDDLTVTTPSLTSAPPLCPFPIYGDLLHATVVDRPDLRKIIFASMMPVSNTSSPTPPAPLSMSKSEPLFTKQQRPQTASGWARTPLQPSSGRGSSSALAGAGGRPLSSSTRASSSTGGRWGLGAGTVPASAGSINHAGGRRPLGRSSSSLGSRPMTATSSRVPSNEPPVSTPHVKDEDPKAKLYTSLKTFIDATTSTNTRNRGIVGSDLTSSAVGTNVKIPPSLISIATHNQQGGGPVSSSSFSAQNLRRGPSPTTGRIHAASPSLFTPTHLASKHSCFDFPVHRCHDNNWSAACVAWEKWLEEHEAGTVEEQQREEREEAVLQARLEQQRRDRINRLHIEIDEWAKEEKKAVKKEEVLAATAAAAEEVITKPTKTSAPPGISLRSGGGCSDDSEDDSTAPRTRPHTPVRSSRAENQPTLSPEAVGVRTRTPSFSPVTPASFTALDTATRSDLKFYVPLVTAACDALNARDTCGSRNVSPPIAASSTDGAIACFDQASQRFQQGDPLGALSLLQSLLPSATVTSLISSRSSRNCGGGVAVVSSPPPSPSDEVLSSIHQDGGGNNKFKQPSRPGTGSGAYHRRRLSDTLRGAVISGRPSTGASSSSRRTTTPPPTLSGSASEGPTKPTPPTTKGSQGKPASTILQPYTADYYSALLLQQPPSSSFLSEAPHIGTITDSGRGRNSDMVFLGVPISLLTNVALCHYAAKDFKGALRVLSPMLAMGTEPASITPLGLVVALRSSLLLVDVRNSKMALSKLMRYKSSFLTADGGGGVGGGGLGVCNGEEVLKGYSLCIDHLEKYRDYTNRSQHPDALTHITAACSASFHHVAFEALRLDTMCYARPAAEVHDDLIQLLEAYPAEQSLWALKAHLIFLFSTSPTTAGNSGNASSSLCAWNALRGAQQAALRALSTSNAECPRASSYLRMLRIVSQHIQAAEDLASQKKWDEAFKEFARVVSGSCMLISKEDTNISSSSSTSSSSISSYLSTSHVTYSGRGCDVETLTLLVGGIAVTLPFASSPELTPIELQNIVQQSIFVITTVKIEMLNCQLKAGKMQEVIEACSLLLNPKHPHQRRSTTTSPPPPISPSIATISPSILKSFRAQAYVHIGRYKEGYMDAKEVYAEAPSAESKEFIDYIESYLYPDRPKQQGNTTTAGGGGSGGGKKRTSGNQHQSRQSSSSGSNHNRSEDSRTTTATLYRVLGLAYDASTSDIAKAYKVAALRWHPDKWASGTEEEKQVAEDNFKEANNAYSVLTGSE